MQICMNLKAGVGKERCHGDAPSAKAGIPADSQSIKPAAHGVNIGFRRIFQELYNIFDFRKLPVL